MWVFTLIGGLRGLLVATGAAGATFALLTVHHAIFVHPALERAARAQGAHAERMVWEAAQKKLRDEMKAARDWAQAEIDRTNELVMDEQARADAAEAELEEKIANEKDADAVGLPLRLRNPVDKAGR